MIAKILPLICLIGLATSGPVYSPFYSGYHTPVVTKTVTPVAYAPVYSPIVYSHGHPHGHGPVTHVAQYTPVVKTYTPVASYTPVVSYGHDVGHAVSSYPYSSYGSYGHHPW